MWIAMAGLPGTGKTGLALRLRDVLGGVVLSKDDARAVLFPPPALDYSREQDDLSMAAVYSAATHMSRTRPGLPILLDGRTFSRSYQVADLFAAAGSTGESPIVIECVCPDEVIRDRLESDHAAGRHPAKNRVFSMYLERKSTAEPLTIPRLVLDTGSTSPDECVARSLRYVHANSSGR
jgi:predicted kinase